MEQALTQPYILFDERESAFALCFDECTVQRSRMLGA